MKNEAKVKAEAAKQQNSTEEQSEPAVDSQLFDHPESDYFKNPSRPDLKGDQE